MIDPSVPPEEDDPFYKPKTLGEALDIYERTAANSEERGEELFDGTGRRNVYICEVCKRPFVTVDRVAGVTPFLKGCVDPRCTGLARSKCYPKNIPSGPAWLAQFEWYRPLRGDDVDPQFFKHISNGGLIFRRIKQ